MRTDGSDSMTKIQMQAQPQKQSTLREWLAIEQKRVEPSLPIGTVSIERFMESVKFAILDPKNPNLKLCDKDSLRRSIAQAANYGLEVGGVLGQSYFIPYNESVKNPQTGAWDKVMTCHFQIGYKGLIELARRSKTIKTIAAEPVYSNDDFDCELASGRCIHHKINIFKDRGEVVAYYCLVELTNGGEQFAILTKSDAEKFRDKYSKSYVQAKQSGRGLDENNWVKNFDAMALKTCVIKALKLCPISIETLRAVQTEEIEDYNDTSVVEPVAEPVSYSVREDNSVEQAQSEVLSQSSDPASTEHSAVFSDEEESRINAQFNALPQGQDPAELF
jgi:recombination protein RecT